MPTETCRESTQKSASFKILYQKILKMEGVQNTEMCKYIQSSSLDVLSFVNILAIPLIAYGIRILASPKISSSTANLFCSLTLGVDGGCRSLSSSSEEKSS